MVLAFSKRPDLHKAYLVQSNPHLVTFKIVKNPDLVKILPVTEFLLIKNLQNSKISAFLVKIENPYLVNT